MEEEVVRCEDIYPEGEVLGYKAKQVVFELVNIQMGKYYLIQI